MKGIMYCVLIYAAGSYVMFNKIHNSSHMVIDEEFHVPQGLAYCNYDFARWDPKITTLPGLYLWSFVILAPLGICNTYGLRLTNYVAGLINIVLFYIWFCVYAKKRSYEVRRVMGAINLAILPPLWFFTNLYYTDTLSVTFVMCMFIANRMEKHWAAAPFGLLAVLMRQTNIIWLMMLMMDYLVKQLYHHCIKPERTKYDITEVDMQELNCQDLFTHFPRIKNMTVNDWVGFYSYAAVLKIFVIFVYINRGIVLGDKSAHVAVIHIPQFFYFSLFCVFFGWPLFIDRIIPFCQLIKRKFIVVSIIAGIMAIIIHFNSLVHPYLLADNRHYTFYIWARFYQNYPLFRYLMIPVYMFGLYCITGVVYTKDNISFSFLFLGSTFIVLVLQKMIEVRYFLVPYVLMRSRYIRPIPFWSVIEFLWYICINYVTLDIFIEKNIFWDDYNYPQKMIW